MSSLFRAHKNGLNVDVVVKRTELGQVNVRRERDIMTNLRHQFLPPIYDYIPGNDGYSYIIMKLIPGCTLSRYIQSKGALGQKQVLKWTRQLCQALDYMHGRGIIHSDIKPENIMITTRGDICLIDFNVSLKIEDGGTMAAGLSMGFAAPEQYDLPLQSLIPLEELPPDKREEGKKIREMVVAAQGIGKVTPRIDLYAVGAVAYFMLTGDEPAPWNEPLIPLERYEIVLGDPLRQIIERCMELDPAARFSSARELSRALDNLGKMDGRYKAWRRKCALSALGIASGLLVSVFCVLWGWHSLRLERSDAYNELIAQSRSAHSQLLYDKEEATLLEARNLEPERPEAYAHLAALLYEQGRYEEALDLLDWVEPSVNGSLGQSEALWAQGQIQYVLASCQYQLRYTRPDDSRYSYNRALLHYQTAALFCPDEAAYQRDLAVCLACLRYMSESAAALKVLEGMEQEPGDLELVSGEIAYFDGRYEEALELLLEAERLSDDPVAISRASLQAADCCEHLGGLLRQEYAVLSDALNRLPAAQNAPQRQRMAETLIWLAEEEPAQSRAYYEQAWDCLDTLLRTGQAKLNAYFDAVLVLERLNRFSEAENILLPLLDSYPQDYRPPMYLASLYNLRENAKPAGERDYQNVIRYYEQAEALYAPVAAVRQDSDMARLGEIVALLRAQTQ